MEPTTGPMTGSYYVNPHNPPPPPKRGMSNAMILLIIFGSLGGLLVLAGIGAALGPKETPSASSGMGTPDPYKPTPNAPTAAEVPTTVPPTPAGPVSTFGEGDYNVGTDIVPGTYRTREPIGNMCYWGIYKGGTNKSDIVDNDIVTGGRPTVTLKSGQEFSSSGCGDWIKTG